MRYFGILLLALLAPPALAAQRPVGHSVLRGTVHESASGRAAPRSQVCAVLPSSATIWHACAQVDTASGQYVLDDLPQGHWRILATCATRGLFGHLMAEDSIAVSDAAPVRRNWRVATTGCDLRPLRQVHGMFRGYFTPGFESSEFVPCAADAWFVPADSLKTEPYDQRRAWAQLLEGSLPRDFTWPAAPRNRYGSPRYYVQWRGTVVGPGHYGHMGISPFEIRVDSVAMLRAPRDGDCQPLTSAATPEP